MVTQTHFLSFTHAGVHPHSHTYPIDTTLTLAKLSVLRTAGGKRVFIIKRLSSHWRNLGVLLDFDESGTQLDIIKKKHPSDPEACCRVMFQHWLKGNGVRPSSWRTLIELLEDCAQQVLAQEIQDALTVDSKSKFSTCTI